MNISSNKSVAAVLQFHRLLKEDAPGVVLGSFSKHGGKSKLDFSSHNISFGVGDIPDNVRHNRQLIKKCLDLDYLVSAHHVHGKEIYTVSSAVDSDIVADGVDALITDIPGVGLLVGHADCQAVLIYDPVRRVIAAIHNGWRGSVANIIAATITAMQQQFQSSSTDLLVGVSPSLGPCCSEFINHREKLPDTFQKFQTKKNYFDFWQISHHQLIQCGVADSSIRISGICTSCSADFFSYRRACRNGVGVTGRNGSVIAMV